MERKQSWLPEYARKNIEKWHREIESDGECWNPRSPDALFLPENYASFLDEEKSRAEAGDEFAMHRLANFYPCFSFCRSRTDKWVDWLTEEERNRQWIERVKWIRACAERGDVSALYWLFDYYSGNSRCYGARRDLFMMFALVRRIAQRGTDSGWQAYFTGRVPDDSKYAVERLVTLLKKLEHLRMFSLSEIRRKAEHGSADARFHLGECYYWGECGANVSHFEAAYWYTKAARQGHVWAQMALGDCYFWGCGVHREAALAEKWYLHAALRNRYYNGWSIPKNKRDMQGVLTEAECHRQDIERLSNWRKAVASDDEDAMCELANYYFYFSGYEREMYFWAARAAKQMLAEGVADETTIVCGLGGGLNVWIEKERKLREEGMYRIGCFLHPRRYVDIDPNDWFHAGECLYWGWDGTVDRKRAFECYKKAAVRGETCAQTALGDCYRYGQGCSCDKKTAEVWYWRAAAKDGRWFGRMPLVKRIRWERQMFRWEHINNHETRYQKWCEN